MPGFTPMAHRLPPPPMLPLMARDRKMAFEQAAQYEIQCRDQHIRELEMEIVRLKVKLEQKEKDVKMAMNMIMVAGRANEKLEAEENAGMTLKMNTDMPRARTAIHQSGWGDPPSKGQAPVEPRPRFSRTRDGPVGKARKSHRASDHITNDESNASFLPTDGWGAGAMAGPPSTIEWGRTRHWVEGGQVEANGWDESGFKQPSSVHPVESLLDLEDDGEILRGAQSRAGANNTWTMPPPLPALSPLVGTANVVSHDLFKTEESASGSPLGSVEDKPRTEKPNFQHLFPDESDDDEKVAPFPEYDELKAKHDYEAKQKDILMRSSLPDFISKVPEASPQMHAKSPQPPVNAPRGPTQDRITSQESGHQADSKEVDVSSGMITPFSNEMNDPSLQETRSYVGHGNVPAHRNGRAPYNTSSEDSDERPFRHNINKAAPWSADAVKYLPIEGHKNFLRTIMLYNLPPQVDVSEITARVGDAPLLSIKLLPTMGMKGRKKDGTTGVLDTMTAMMVFAVDTSAEQFAFDAERRPLVIRGRTTLVKLLETPTYPAGLSDRAYATAPGRLYSRRIRFHQPGLIPADEFDDTLAGHSYGYKQPGWIVSKDMQKMAGKNMITIEFASVATARFAWEQFGWLREFQGCEPRWVYDHEARAMDRYRRALRTRDDDDHSDMEVVQDIEMPARGLAVETTIGLRGSKHVGGEFGRVGVVRHPEVPSFGALPDFCRPKVTNTIELDY